MAQEHHRAAMSHWSRVSITNKQQHGHQPKI